MRATSRIIDVLTKSGCDPTYGARHLQRNIERLADDLVAFSYEEGRVRVCGRGFEVELSKLRGW